LIGRRGERILAVVVASSLLFASACKSVDGARDIAAGVSVIAAIPAFAGNPIAVGAEIAQGVTFIVIGIIELFSSAAAQPDGDFEQLPSVTLVKFTPVGPSSQSGSVHASAADPSIDHINQSLKAAGEIIDNTRLIKMSLRKYYGAWGAGNIDKAKLQRTFTCNCIDKLTASFQSYHDALLLMSADIQGTPAASASATVADVLALRNQIVSSGQFPANETFVFTEAQATSEEMTHALEQVAAVNGTTISNSDLTGAAIFAQAASVVDHANIQEFLPPGFTCADVTAPDLVVTKSAPATGLPGGNITYTIGLTNSGADTAANVSLTDTLPANTTFVSASAPAGFTCATPPVGASGTVACTDPSLAAFTSATLTITVNVGSPLGSTISNTANASTTTFEPNLANNSATAPTVIAVSIPTLSPLGIAMLAFLSG
jgi:uncharacterized repeat protein (TIGR01451 family)